MYCIFPVSYNSICFVRLMIKKISESQCYARMLHEDNQLAMHL